MGEMGFKKGLFWKVAMRLFTSISTIITHYFLTPVE